MYAFRYMDGWYRRPGIYILLSKLHLELGTMFRSTLRVHVDVGFILDYFVVPVMRTRLKTLKSQDGLHC